MVSLPEAMMRPAEGEVTRRLRPSSVEAPGTCAVRPAGYGNVAKALRGPTFSRFSARSAFL